ncbi:trinucleotide repeat-containing gene 18 protein [Eucalyptus grandis]|uniref:trinucleotide repeat-containing gene 18 protein n=1 Tax=Eucalyptus grandis TaxID=71139 RepID=UPI00192E763D|nr:trinucleotide repeat-containing gene 18 protein [Eucalyptus grandis]
MEALREGGNEISGVAADQDQDAGDGMQCADHPFRGNLGGICAFCLQEKLGKLVSSSSPLPLPRPPSSSSASSSPPFRSGAAPRGYAAAFAPAPAPAPAASSVSVNPAVSLPSNRQDGGGGGGGDVYHARRASRIVPFLLAKNKSRKKKKAAAGATTPAAEMISFKRSKSTATPRRGGGRFLDEEAGNDDFSPRRRGGFWSFLYPSSYSAASGSGSGSGSAVARRDSKSHSQSQYTSNAMNGPIVEDGNSDNAGSSSASAATSFERKVSRSRSVGCGSRSFSGDFFERISTGFGDCTLRRVESQREAGGRSHQKPRISAAHGGERVRCGGIFGGFAAMASSSSSSSSSSHWVSTGCSADQEMAHSSSSRSSVTAAVVHGGGARGHRSWGWAFTSPMRAFGRPAYTKDAKRERSVVASRNRNNATTSPNLAAIPSLLAVRG